MLGVSTAGSRTALRRAATAMAATLAFCGEPLEGQSVRDTTWLRSSRARGRVPINVEIVRSFAYPGADAVIVRHPTEAPRERILIKASAASSELLQRALYLLSVLHGQDSGCPTKAAVVRVPQSGRLPEPPSWVNADAILVGRVFGRLSAELASSSDRHRAVSTLWVKRVLTRDFVTARGGVIDFEAPCPSTSPPND